MLYYKVFEKDEEPASVEKMVFEKKGSMLSACELHVPCMTAKFDRDVYSSICYPRAVFFFAKPERWFRTPLRYQKEHSIFEPLAHLGSASCAQ